MAAGNKQTSHQLLACVSVCVEMGAGGAAQSAIIIIIMTILDDDMSGTPKCALIVTMTSGSAPCTTEQNKVWKGKEEQNSKGYKKVNIYT